MIFLNGQRHDIPDTMVLGIHFVAGLRHRFRPSLASRVPAIALSMLALFATTAQADSLVWLPGNSRAIGRSTSASRDSPTSGLLFAPRVAGKAAADFAFARVPFGGVALRPGLDAFFELEHSQVGVGGSLPLPGQGKGWMLWRGMYRWSLAFSAERLARRWFGERGALEIVLGVGHESDHVTADHFNDAPRRGDIRYGGGGNFVLYELAAHKPLGDRTELTIRAEDRDYARPGTILRAPGLDLVFRYRALPHCEPVVSLFAERLFVDPNLNAARNGYFAALLVGPAIPGQLGEVLLYSALEVGNGKGLLINHRELRWALGARFAPF